MRDEEVGLGRPQAGDQVVAGTGGEAVVALGDVVEVARCELVQAVEVRQHLGGAEGLAAGEDAALVGDGGHAGPERRRHAGAADLHPRGRGAEVERVVDGHAGVRVGVGSDVGIGALAVVAAEAVVLLVGGYREGLAVPAAAAGPADLVAPLTAAS